MIIKTSGSWVNHSLLMAVFSDGQKSHMIKKGAIKRDDFVQFIDSLNLGADTMLLMDNASIHKGMQLQTKPDICYTPPYSPEFNPIELCFSQLKRSFRKRNTGEHAVQGLIDGTVQDLSPDAIKACFRHVLTTFVTPVEGIKPEPVPEPRPHRVRKAKTAAETRTRTPQPRSVEA